MKRTIYNEDHEAFRATIRDFIAKEVTPYFADWEEVGYPPRELFRKLADLGLTGFGIPEEFGGAGDVSFKYQAIIAEESALSAVAMYNYGISQASCSRTCSTSRTTNSVRDGSLASPPAISCCASP